MKSRIIVSVLASGVLLIAPVVAEASIATSYLSMDSTKVSQIEDFDWEILVYDADSDDEIDDGDILLGVFESEKVLPDYSTTVGSITPSPTAGDVNFTAVFANKAANKSQDAGGTWRWDFVPLTLAEWNTLQTIGGLTNLPSRVDNNSMIIVYSDPNPSSTGWVDPDANVNNTIGRASDGQKLFEFGTTAGGNETWYAESKNDDISSLVASDNLIWHAGLSETYTDPVVSSIVFIAHDVLGLGNNYDLELTGGSQGTKQPPWLKTNTSLYVNTVPEPASVVVWSLIFAFPAVVAFRRRSGRS